MEFEKAKEQVKKDLESEPCENTMHSMWIQSKLNALEKIKSIEDLASIELIKYSTATVSFNEHTSVSAMIRKLMKI